MKIRVIAATAAVTITASPLSGCAAYQKARQMSDDPDSTPPAAQTDQQRIALIDSLRPRGSFEAARAHLTAIAGSVAEQISQAVPGGKPWTFDSTSELATDARNGVPCDNDLSAGTARKPDADPVQFDVFAPGDFTIAVGVIRREAAALGATEESSLFDDPAKREYVVSGNGYLFRILQINSTWLTVSGDCHLLQKVIDSPPGTLP